jgi:hypothetical protein
MMRPMLAMSKDIKFSEGQIVIGLRLKLKLHISRIKTQTITTTPTGSVANIYLLIYVI